MNVITITQAAELYGVDVVLGPEDVTTTHEVGAALGLAATGLTGGEAKSSPGESLASMLTPSSRRRIPRFVDFPASFSRGKYPATHVRAWAIEDQGDPIEQHGTPTRGERYSTAQMFEQFGVVVTITPDDVVTTAEIADLLRIRRTSISAQLANANRAGWRGREGVGPTPWKLMGLPVEIVTGVRDRRATYRWLVVKEAFQQPQGWATFTPEGYTAWEQDRYAELIAEGADLTPLAVQFKGYGRTDLATV